MFGKAYSDSNTHPLTDGMGADEKREKTKTIPRTLKMSRLKMETLN